MAFIARLVAIWAFAIMAMPLSAGASPPSVARVVKLTHLAVILPELQQVRDDWDCELWTPSVEQVAAAEKAIFRRMKKDVANGAEFNLHGWYIIQYYGIVLKGTKWIVCSVTDIRTLDSAAHGEDGSLLPDTLTEIFARPYGETDSDYWFEAFYDPVADKLSDSPGLVREEPTEGEEEAKRDAGRDSVARHHLRARVRRQKERHP
jgi:hypothetical protein